MAKKKAEAKFPKKQCPKCGATLHARKHQCECGYTFPLTAKAKKKAKAKAASKAKKPGRPAAKAAPAGFVDTLRAERETLASKLEQIDSLLKSYSES